MKTTKAVKQGIHGDGGLSDKEKLMDSGEQLYAFPWEKPVPLCEDLLQHGGVNGLLLGSSGAGNWILASIRYKIKVLALTKNQAHQDFLINLLEN